MYALFRGKSSVAGHYSILFQQMNTCWILALKLMSEWSNLQCSAIASFLVDVGWLLSIFLAHFPDSPKSSKGGSWQHEAPVNWQICNVLDIQYVVGMPS